MVHRTAPKPPDPLRPWLPRGAPFFATIAVAVLVWLVGATTRIVCQGKLSQVRKDDSEKDVRSIGQRRLAPRSRERFHSKAFDAEKPSGR